MAGEVTVLAFTGSTRPGSFNALALAVAAQGVEAAGGRVRSIDLGQFPLPLFDGIGASGRTLPGPASDLAKLIQEHDALLVASPEYNGGMAPLVKNAIDWVSCARADQSAPTVFAGKVAALLTASTERSIGMQGIVQLTSVLHWLGTVVIPGALGVGAADRAFDASGRLVDQGLEKRVMALGQSLVDYTRRLRAV